MASAVLVTDDDITIQGVTAAGVAAMTTVTTSSGARNFVSLRDPAQTFTGQNLIFDATAAFADAGNHKIFDFRGNSQGGHTIRYCALLGGASGVQPAANRLLASTTTVPSLSDQGTVEYCYYQNTRAANDGSATLGDQFTFDHCVFLNDSSLARIVPVVSYGAFAGSDSGRRMTVTNCTFYEDAGAGAIIDILFYNPSTNLADVGEVTCHSNVAWVESSGTVNSFLGGDGTAAAVTMVGTIGPNVLVGGPSVTSGSLTSAGWYEEQWDANEDDATDPDTWPTDVVVYGEADTVMFNDPASTLEWVLPNALTIPILKDLRLLKYATGGLFGSLPGALPAIAGGVDPDDDEDAANLPFLDVLPLIAPVLELTLNMGIRLGRNDVNQAMVTRSDTEGRSFREYKTERLQLPANTTTTFRSGIENADYLMVDSTTAVQISTGAAAGNFWPASTQAVISDGDFSVLQFKTGASSATILITEVD